ncbi:pof4 [Linum perenne]
MMMREGKRVAPSLVDLCVNVAIENVKYLGDVGETDSDLLGRILCHCTLEQLTHVEESTVGRDLSPVTDSMWRKFYELNYGERSTNLVLERMKLKKVSFQWKQLYEAKSKDVAEAENKAGARFREGYKNVDARKQRRQIQVCSKVPPSSNKRSWGGGYDTGNSKSSIMKKAKIDFLKSREVKNITAMNKRAAQRRISSTSTPASRPPTIMRPTSSFTGRNPSAPLSSSARPPMQRRF